MYFVNSLITQLEYGVIFGRFAAFLEFWEFLEECTFFSVLSEECTYFSHRKNRRRGEVGLVKTDRSRQGDWGVEKVG